MKFVDAVVRNIRIMVANNDKHLAFYLHSLNRVCTPAELKAIKRAL